MILAEQGHEVIKWVSPEHPDPIEGLRHGAELWRWINHGKIVYRRHAREVPCALSGGLHIAAVIDNIRATTWQNWNVDPSAHAGGARVPWVSLRDDLGGRSFDAIAQARAWGDHIGYIPAYLGDTSFGLWAAFKLLAAPPGHHVLHQAACLAKLVEGEAQVSVRRDGASPPWDDPGTYGRDGDGVTVVFRGSRHHEPFRDETWRREHLRHVAGRYVI